MRTLFFIIAICAQIPLLTAQRALEKGNRAYDKLEYAKAIEWYLKALEDGVVPEAAERLAHCYRLTNQYAKALRWYSQVAGGQPADPDSKLYYARMLLIAGKKDEADRWAQAFLADKPGDRRGLALREGVRQMEQFYRQEGKYTLEKAPFNAPDASDFAPAYYPGGLVFTSDRGTGDKENPWTGRAFSGLFFANGSRAVPLRGEVNSRYHDGVACFTDNGRSMYFTRSNRHKGRGNEVQLSLESAELDGNSWRLAASFPYNSKDFSTGHPAISKDGNTLVFSSDRPGTAGRMDLFVSRRQGGAWSQPQNLGNTINTPGNEVFPFLTDEGHLVFASDGHPGIGGLDLYIARYRDGAWQAPENLGFPINSPGDDFSLVAQGELTEGYFASNRDSDDGLDDIYFFRQSKPANELTVQVVDEFTRIPLPDVAVTLRDLKTGDVQTGRTNAQGQVVFPMYAERSYEVSGEKNGIATTVKQEQVGMLSPGEARFVELEHNDPRFTLRGKCLTSKEKTPVPGVKVRLTNLRTMKVEITTSDAEGNFNFQLEQNSEYQLVGEKDDYFTTVGRTSTKGLNRSRTLYATLFLSIDVIQLDIINRFDDNGTTVINQDTFRAIYYSFDKSDILPKSAKELDKLVSLLKWNPGLEIELLSHTDCRGDDDYNKELSQRRSESAMLYLTQHGIARRRIIPKGYGEERLTNECDDGVYCTETQHQQNRRTEFVIVKK
ncbi:MAG: OmpA family protein [Lewinellaceae bacterium]|nr:OmpA family protein [Lewinellaceae bacterium]